MDYKDETINTYIKAPKKGSTGPIDHLNKSAVPMDNMIITKKTQKNLHMALCIPISV